MILRQGFALRIALVGDLFLFHTAMIMFILLPIFGDVTMNELTTPEIILGGVGILLCVPLLGRLFEKPYIPLNQWAYLMVGGYMILSALLFFVIIVPDETLMIESTIPPLIAVLYLSGMFGAFSAHIVDGSRKPLIDRINKRLCQEELLREHDS